MSSTSYRTAPDHNLKGWPSSIGYIVGNEGCERFSYYGMSAILYVYIVSLYVGVHIADKEAGDLATSTVHFFKTGVYAFPMIGAIIADRLFGKYQTILWLSLIYCLGHAVLSMTEGSTMGLYAGLALIAIGSGGIKPCVSAQVGDQFGRSNWHLMDRVYQIFYFTINFGSFFATLFIPLLQKWFGWSVAFAVPGVLMFIATLIFWMGRKDFVRIPAKPGGKLGFLDATSSVLLFMTFGSLFFTAHQPLWIMGVASAACLVAGLWLFQIRQGIAQDDGFLAVSWVAVREWTRGLLVREPIAALSSGGGTGGFGPKERLQSQFSEEAIDGAKAVLRIVSVFFMVSIFWSLFDQNASSWVRQAEMMDRHFNMPLFGAVEFLPSQIQSLNPVLVMLMIPLLTYIVFPRLMRAGIRISPLQKMTIGMSIACFSFVAVALIQKQIDVAALNGEKVHVAWQFFPFFLLTLAEVLVSATGLEFAYTQAPRRMKSTVMGFWLLSVALGNVLVAFTARFANLELVDFFWVFAGLMALAALMFGVRAAFYVEHDYQQQ